MDSDADQVSASQADPDDEVQEWAEREHRRRQAWANGPTETEKREYIRRRAQAGGGRSDLYTRYPYASSNYHQMRRDAELAWQGAWAWVTDGPFWLWRRLRDTGFEWEQQVGTDTGSGRIPLYCD